MAPTRTGIGYVSYGLIAANVAVFIVGLAMGDSLSGRGDVDGLVFDAATWGAAIDVLNEWWRVFTGGFLHHGVLHLAVNMCSLVIFGPSLERLLGRVSFAAVYLASLVSGSFGALMETPNSLVAGASGAILGLLGAYAALSLFQGVGLFQTPLGPILIINVVIGFTEPSVSMGGHIGGLIGGFLVGAAAAQAMRRQLHTTAVPLLAAAGVAAISFAGALWAATRWTETL